MNNTKYKLYTIWRSNDGQIIGLLDNAWKFYYKESILERWFEHKEYANVDYKISKGKRGFATFNALPDYFQNYLLLKALP